MSNTPKEEDRDELLSRISKLNPPQNITSKENEEWDEKEYLANLHFLMGDRTEHEWTLILGIIQGKINSLLTQRDNEWKLKLKEIHNKCLTERGLSVALVNLIKKS